LSEGAASLVFKRRQLVAASKMAADQLRIQVQNPSLRLRAPLADFISNVS